MPRRREIPKREVLPDPIYNSQLVTKFVNVVMRDGKKSVAERILYDALDAIRQRTSDDPMKVFKKAIENVKPAVEVKSRRVGGSTYQVPVEGRPSRKLALSMRWIITAAAAPSRRRKTRTGWRRPTRRSRTTAGSRSTHRSHLPGLSAAAGRPRRRS